MSQSPSDASDGTQLPGDLQARLRDAGVTDQVSLQAALAHDPTLKRDIEAFVAEQAPMALLLQRFAAAASGEDVLALWREVPSELEAPLIDAVEALIAATERFGQHDNAETLRQRLEQFRQIQSLVPSEQQGQGSWFHRTQNRIKGLIGRTLSREAREPAEGSTSQGTSAHPLVSIADRAAREAWDDNRIEQALAEIDRLRKEHIADLPTAAAEVDDPRWHHAVCVCLRLIACQSEKLLRLVIRAAALPTIKRLLKRRNDRALLNWLPLAIELHASTQPGGKGAARALALLGTLHHELGNALDRQLKHAEAETAFRNAVAIYTPLAQRNPGYAKHVGNAWHEIGNALLDQLKHAEAEAAYRQALAIYSPLAQRNPMYAQDVADAWHGIGNALFSQLKHADAEAAYRQALAIYSPLAQRNPMYAQDVADAWHGIGNALDSQLKHSEAEAAFRQALATRTVLAQRDPAHDLRVADEWLGIGNALNRQLKHAEAEAAVRQSLAIYTPLAHHDPAHGLRVGAAWRGIGNALNSQFKYAEAEAAYRQALAIYTPLAPRNPVYANDMAKAWSGIGSVLVRGLKPAEAEAAFRQALTVFAPLAQRDPVYAC